ncbi:MAG TPA: hypothetical protein VGI47_11295 [Candidatus Binataceae bacterium]
MTGAEALADGEATAAATAALLAAAETGFVKTELSAAQLKEAVATSRMIARRRPQEPKKVESNNPQ